MNAVTTKFAGGLPYSGEGGAGRGRAGGDVDRLLRLSPRVAEQRAPHRPLERGQGLRYRRISRGTNRTGPFVVIGIFG